MVKKKKRIRVLKFIYFIATLLLITSLFYNKIVPDLIRNSATGLLVLLLIIESLIDFKKFLLITLSFAMILSSGALFYSQHSLSRIIKQDKIEINTVTFVVLKDGPLTKIEDLVNAKIGLPTQMDESITAFVEDYLTTTVKEYTIKEATDDISNYELLIDKNVDMMVLDNSMRDIMIEKYPDFETQTRIIYTFEKSVVKIDTSISVDAAKESFILLISGVDSRTAGAVRDIARSDVNILMVVNPMTHNVLTISIPRDTYTPLGCKTGGMDKLTHAGMYGVDCTVKTVEKLFDLKINYYVKVNFTAFTNIIKVLGTIDVYSKYAFKMNVPKNPSKSSSAVTKYSVKEGMNTMNGLEALMFARTRHSFENGDEQRGLNQQEVIKGMINKIIDSSTLLKIEGLVGVASESVVTNMPLENVTKLIQSQISNNTPWNITTSALTGKADSQPTYSMGKDRPLYVAWPDKKILVELKVKIYAYFNRTK